MIKKILSLILAISMIAAMPAAAFAQENAGEEHVCSADCQEHNPAQQPQPQCSCEDRCAEGAVNAECAVCSAEGADLSACAGKAAEPQPEPQPELQPQCGCVDKCIEGAVNAECALCSAEGADLSDCVGKAAEPQPEPQPQCGCVDKCTEGAANAECAVCSAEGADLSACIGKAAEVKPEAQLQPQCSCGAKCSKEYMEPECPVCSLGGEAFEKCGGEAFGNFLLRNYTGSGIMEYKQIEDTTIDVNGISGSNKIQTTYKHYGYLLKHNMGSSVSVTANPSFTNGGRYVKLAYTVKNDTAAAVSGALGICADVMIGADDKATITTVTNSSGNVIGFKMVDTNKTKQLQFNLFFRGTGGVTNADRYWMGAYNSGNFENNWNASTDLGSFGGTVDSALAVSWNVALQPGESKTYSVIVGVGEAAAAPQWQAADPVTLTMTAEATKENLKINVSAKVKDANGVVDSLYYSENNSQEQQLGESVTGDGVSEKEIAGVIDLTGKADGVYEYLFWVVNDKGAASEAVKRTITISGGSVSGDVVMPAGCEEGEHEWEERLSADDTKHWNNCEKPWCSGKNNSEDHVFEAGAEGAELQMKCECGLKHTATVVAPANLVYDGSEKQADIVYSEKWAGGTPMISYFQKNGQELTALESAPKAVGTYVARITPNTRSANVLSAEIEFGITPKTIEPTITLEPDEFVYNGSEHEPDEITVTVPDGSLVGNDTLEYDVAYSSDKVNAGTVTVTFTAKGNYAFAEGKNTATYVIKPAKVTITAQDKVINEGEDEPKYSCSVTGLVRGETLTKFPSYEAKDLDVNVPGKYKIIPSGASAGNNYTIEYVEGELTVKAKYTVKVTTSTGGTVSVDPGKAAAGETIVIKPSPNAKYVVRSITVKNAAGKAITVGKNSAGNSIFTMPASDATVTVSFKLKDSPDTGDRSNLALWTALAAGSLMAAGGAGIYLRRRKDN